MKLTKQELCGLTLLGCVIGLAGAAITIAALWAMVYRPYWFWLVMVAALVNLLLGFVVGWVYEWRAWWRARRREQRIQPTYSCLTCGYSTKNQSEMDAHLSCAFKDRGYLVGRRERRQELWSCRYCGKLQPLDEHVAHRCGR